MWLWPNGSTVKPRLSTPLEWAQFGPRNIGKGFHDGVDFGAYFTFVHSVEAGVVSRVEVWNGKVSMQHGNRVYVDHGGGVVSSYSHLAAITVVRGQRINAGGIVGPMGVSGYVTGKHLHLEITVNGKLVDPEAFLAARVGGQGAGGGGTPFLPERRQKEDEMYVRGTTATDVVYKVWTDELGTGRIRLCGPMEANFAITGGLVVTGYDNVLEALGKELKYNEAWNGTGQQVWVNTTISRKDADTGVERKIPAIQDLADTGTLVRDLLARPATTLTAEQVKAIADAVASQVGEPDVDIDYERIAEDVRDKFRIEPLS